MNDRERQFEQVLTAFPKATREHLQAISGNGGKLTQAQCSALVEIMGIAVEGLMVRLLPIAKTYAVIPISHFQVGAVAKARSPTPVSDFELYLGANIEFLGQALGQTVHAEQAATVNAWASGAGQLQSIAVSAAPCGYCRQFLAEFEGSGTLMILTPSQGASGFSSTRLNQLLPDAFGPHDLKKKAASMAPSKVQQNLTLKTASADALVLEALSAANQSHAPYTNNFAGCAIQVTNGETYTGRYVENAAFNPSLSPLQAAISCMNMDRLAGDQTITRAVLVEKPSGSRQRDITELLLRSFAPHVSLEYSQAE
ncbi:MAG: cytidine deaminase [Proteobacteria bacterium]|nr:cytidine deaminase [Pseudomonadota bacterium]NIS70635.1 cytidine deaminase [Pseudomonadota bacterium]